MQGQLFLSLALVSGLVSASPLSTSAAVPSTCSQLASIVASSQISDPTAYCASYLPTSNSSIMTTMYAPGDIPTTGDSLLTAIVQPRPHRSSTPDPPRRCFSPSQRPVAKGYRTSIVFQSGNPPTNTATASPTAAAKRDLVSLPSNLRCSSES